MLSAELLIKRLLDSGIACLEDVVGCSEAEIRHIEETNGILLPGAYKDFLRAVGKGAGRLMRDIDFTYPDIMNHNRDAEELLSTWEKGALTLPASAFVFSMRYGEQFAFFVADGTSEDPPISLYYEGAGRFRNIANSLWETIEEELLLSEKANR